MRTPDTTPPDERQEPRAPNIPDTAMHRRRALAMLIGSGIGTVGTYLAIKHEEDTSSVTTRQCLESIDSNLNAIATALFFAEANGNTEARNETMYLARWYAERMQNVLDGTKNTVSPVQHLDSVLNARITDATLETAVLSQRELSEEERRELLRLAAWAETMSKSTPMFMMGSMKSNR